MKISERNNPFRKKVAGIAVTSFLLSMLLQAVSLIPVMMMPAVVDTYIPAGEIGKVICGILAFCGIPVLVTFGHNWYEYYLMLESRRLIARVNLECFDKLIHQPMAFFDENHSAELAKKASADIVSYIAVWTIDLPKLISNAVSGVLVFLLLCRVHVLIALFQVLYIPVSLILMKLVGNLLQQLIARVVDFNAQYQKQMQEAFRSIRLVKAQVTEEQEDRKVEDIQKGMLKIWGRVAFFDNFVGGISHTLMPGFFHGATFIIAALLAALQVISIGYMTAAVGYASRIHDIFTNLISTYNGYKKARGQVSAIQGYLELEDERDNAGTGRWRLEREIVFDNVVFRYPRTKKDILRHKSFRIKKGDWVGSLVPAASEKARFWNCCCGFMSRMGDASWRTGSPWRKSISTSCAGPSPMCPRNLCCGRGRFGTISCLPDRMPPRKSCCAPRKEPAYWQQSRADWTGKSENRAWRCPVGKGSGLPLPGAFWTAGS